MTIIDKIYVFGLFLSIVNVIAIWLIISHHNTKIYRALIAICTKLNMTPQECRDLLSKDL